MSEPFTDLVFASEPGTVIAVDDWWLVKLRPYHEDSPEIPGGWELLPSPKHASIRAYEAGIKEQCVYSDEWVQQFVEDEEGFRVIARPITDTTEGLNP